MKKIIIMCFFMVSLFACTNDITLIQPYDGKQIVELKLSTLPNLVEEGVTQEAVLTATAYDLYLFSDGLFTESISVSRDTVFETKAATYTYLCVGAEHRTELPKVVLEKGISTLEATFLLLNDKIASSIPRLIVATGNFTMNSTINTLAIGLKPLGCSFFFSFPKISADIKAIKVILEGCSAGYDFALNPIKGDAVSMQMMGADADGWVANTGTNLELKTRFLVSNVFPLSLSITTKNLSNIEKEYKAVKIDKAIEGLSYIADLYFEGDDAKLVYKSPFNPLVKVTQTTLFNENELRVVSKIYDGYTYQWRHERMGRAVLSGVINGIPQYVENGIPEGAVVKVSGAGNYILSITKEGTSTDIYTVAVSHAQLTWSDALDQVKKMGTDYMLPDIELMKKLVNAGINDFAYNQTTDQSKTIWYWSNENDNINWAKCFNFDPKSTTSAALAIVEKHAVRILKKLPFVADPKDPYSVGIMEAPEPYVGSVQLTITTKPFDGAVFQWKHAKTGRRVLKGFNGNTPVYIENGIPEGATVEVFGAGEYILSISYKGVTKEVGSVLVKSKRLNWVTLETELKSLSSTGIAWYIPTSEQLKAAYNGGTHDFDLSWYWCADFTNAANRWKTLVNFGDGTTDGGDITMPKSTYNIRFFKPIN